MQTLSLRLEDSLGREYTLRSIEKFPESIIPSDLRSGMQITALSNGVSGAYPYASLSVPVLEKAISLGDDLQLNFSHTGKGLMANDGEPLRCFAVAGADKKFYWADAEINDANTVILRCKQASHPVWVRYAWADNPDRPNLYNREGLPASPFQFEIKN